ncbi:MAG TPA: MBOAT family O-acyltransferase [Bryobacteraceae bacterium]
MNPLLFTDPVFLFLFLPMVLAGYYLIPRPARNPFLLGASLLLYTWGEEIFSLVLLSSIAINYGGGVAMKRSRASARKTLLVIGIVLNLLLLGTFKYTGFVVQNYNTLATHLGVRTATVSLIHLPIGVSFYTFMGISYLVDAYRDASETEPRPARFALYLSLFPHLIAGPIVRYSDIAAQLGDRPANLHNLAVGMRRFIVGLGKKVLISNTVAVPSDAIMKLPQAALTTPLAWFGIACYTLQIYYDFSGYSDMAIGLAKMFGFKFPENFNYPYVSRSITEFWKRWHMTLSSWLRDYLFFPLGVRGPRFRLYINIMIVFALCGLWHGARWHFVAWGLFQGLLLMTERAALLKLLDRLPRFASHAYAVFAILTGWVFFRAEDVPTALGYLRAMFRFPSAPALSGLTPYFTPRLVLVVFAGVLGCMPFAPALNRWLADLLERVHAGAAAIVQTFATTVRIAFYSATLSGSLIMIAAGTYSAFIYFRF